MIVDIFIYNILRISITFYLTLAKIIYNSLLFARDAYKNKIYIL